MSCDCQASVNNGELNMSNTNPHLLPDSIGSQLFLLTDKAIKAAKAADYLFMGEEDFEIGRVRQASYELTLQAGRTLTGQELPTLPNQEAPGAQEGPAFHVDIGGERHLIVNPWQCCLLMVKEQIRLPDNVVGHVMSRGQLFQSGLIVESTYVDPGYKPNEQNQSIHLMAFNATQRVIKLPIGVAVARLELVRISESVEKPHGGRNDIRQPEMSSVHWPWPSNLATRGKEIDAARALRDGDSRLLSMDRIALALTTLHGDVDKIEKTAAWQRIFLYIATPIILWLILRALDIGSYLNVEMNDKYTKLADSIPSFVPFLFFGVVIPGILAIIKKDFRAAFKTVSGRDVE